MWDLPRLGGEYMDMDMDMYVHGYVCGREG